MGQHRILRIASRRERVVRFCEVWPNETQFFNFDQEAALDLGCIVQIGDQTFVDLNAYYEVSEAERGARALELVS